MIYRSQAYYKQYSSLWKGYTAEYKLNDQGNAADQSTLSENMTIGWNWGVTNTLNYKFDVAKEHHFDVLVGTEYSREGNNMGETLEAMAKVMSLQILVMLITITSQDVPVWLRLVDIL